MFTSSYHLQDSDYVKQHADELLQWIIGNSTLRDEQLYQFDESKIFTIKLLALGSPNSVTNVNIL